MWRRTGKILLRAARRPLLGAIGKRPARKCCRRGSRIEAGDSLPRDGVGRQGSSRFRVVIAGWGETGASRPSRPVYRVRCDGSQRCLGARLRGVVLASCCRCHLSHVLVRLLWTLGPGQAPRKDSRVLGKALLPPDLQNGEWYEMLAEARGSFLRH